MPDYERLWNGLRMALQFRAGVAKTGGRWDTHYTHRAILAVMERMEKEDAGKKLGAASPSVH